MSAVKGCGLVIRQVNVGESDRIITLFLKGYGVAAVSAKGARKPRSRFLAGTEVFTYGDFVLFDGGTFLSLNEVSIIEPFYRLREDLDALSAAAYILDICCRALPEAYPCDDVLLLAVKALQALSAPDPVCGQICCVFELKFLQLSGYLPGTDQAAPGAGGGPDRDFERAMKYITQSEIRDVFKFTCGEPLRRALDAAAYALMESHFDYLLKKRPASQ